MNLTRHQRKLLLEYRSLHNGDPAAHAARRRFIWLAVGIVVIGAVGAVLLNLLHAPALVMFVAGICLGSLVAGAARLGAIPRIWPVLDNVLDWKKIEQVLDEDRTGKAN